MNCGSLHIKNIVEEDLCTGCGICVSMCKPKILKIESGKCKLVNESACINCELCKKCCPSYGYELKDLYKSFYKIFKAKSTNNEIVQNSTSGGAITQLILNLMDKRLVDKAILVKCGQTLDMLAEYFIADSAEEIINASGSNYVIASIEKVLCYVENTDFRYVLVAPPCILYGITMAMKYRPKLRKNILIKIGFICGYTYSNKCVEGLVKYTGNNLSDIKRIVGWRKAGFPGYTVFEKTNGEHIQIPFIIEHSIDVPFYSYKKCLNCKDCFCDYGDIVAGDTGNGWKNKETLLLIRSELGKFCIENCTYDLELKELAFRDIKRTSLQFMEIEKRSKVSVRQKQFNTEYPLWTGNYNEQKLLPFKKIIVQYLNRLLFRMRKNENKYLESPQLLLKLGKKYYGGIESKLLIRNVFIGERLIQILLSIDFRKVINYILNHVSFKRKQRYSRNAITVGIIGLGEWGGQYVDILYKSSNYKIISVCDKNDIVLNKISKKYKLSIESFESMLKNEKIDTIFILSPNHLHEEMIEKALINGKNIYVEKPLTNDYISSKRIAELSLRYDKKLYVAHSLKCGLGFRTLKKMIENHNFGEIKQFYCVRSLHGLDAKTKMSWRANEKFAPMLPMIQLGIHLLDASHYLFGKLKCNESMIHNSYGLVDSVICLLESNEIQGTLMTCYDTENTFEFTIYGSKLVAKLTEDNLIVSRNGKQKILLRGLKKENTLNFEINEYWNWRINNVQPLNTAESAVETMRLFDEVRSRERRLQNEF